MMVPVLVPEMVQEMEMVLVLVPEMVQVMEMVPVLVQVLFLGLVMGRY